MPDEDTTITEEQSDAGAAVPDPEAAPVVSAEPPVSATPAPAEPAGSVAADDEVTAEETTVEPAIEEGVEGDLNTIEPAPAEPDAVAKEVGEDAHESIAPTEAVGAAPVAAATNVIASPAGVEPVQADASPRESSPAAEPNVKEIVIEKERALTDQDKDQIFKDRLMSNLAHARSLKHARFEAHLQEIIDFIRQKGTLVTNQDIEEGLKMPDTTVTARLNELIRRAIVVRVGARRRAKYKLKEAL